MYDTLISQITDKVVHAISPWIKIKFSNCLGLKFIGKMVRYWSLNFEYRFSSPKQVGNLIYKPIIG